jgi:hypothetical protein
MPRILALLFALLACSGEDPAADPVCEAGRVEPCPCSGAADGVQACASDGSKWGTCECEEPRDECTIDEDCESEDAPYCLRGACSPTTVVGPGEQCDSEHLCSEGYACTDDGNPDTTFAECLAH